MTRAPGIQDHAGGLPSRLGAESGRSPGDVADLPSVWRTRADDLRRYGAAPNAAALEQAAAELEAALRTNGDELLHVRQAARESGYSSDHLGRLLKSGAIHNYGRPHAPRIRRADLPLKAGHLPPEAPAPHVIGARGRIARAVVHSPTGD